MDDRLGTVRMVGEERLMFMDSDSGLGGLPRTVQQLDLRRQARAGAPRSQTCRWDPGSQGAERRAAVRAVCLGWVFRPT